MNIRFLPLLRHGALALAAMACAGPIAAAPVDDDVAGLVRDWDQIKYRSPSAEHERRFEALAERAAKVVAAYPDRAEPLVWQGIIVSSLAGARGGLGALSLARQAKAQYEAALKIAPAALDGSAYNSLGVLYYKVPGWPIGFGDKARAEQLLKQALTINPQGIDPNFFYAEYLVETGKAAEAVPFLERALQAPPRLGREIADAGRRDEARVLMDKASVLAGK
jgi:tetratricopeptide (TPR) repeat protein